MSVKIGGNFSTIKLQAFVEHVEKKLDVLIQKGKGDVDENLNVEELEEFEKLTTVAEYFYEYLEDIQAK